MSLSKFCIGVILWLTIWVAGLVIKVHQVKKELSRVENNYNALAFENEEFKSSLGRSTLQCRDLQLTNSELKENNEELQSKLKGALSKIKESAKDLGISTSRIERAEVVESKTIVEVNTEVETTDSTKTFKWNDGYVKVEGLLYKDSVNCLVESNDTIIQILERVPKRFLFFKFGTKYIRQSIQSLNPHTKLVYATSITIR